MPPVLVDLVDDIAVEKVVRREQRAGVATVVGGVRVDEIGDPRLVYDVEGVLHALVVGRADEPVHAALGLVVRSEPGFEVVARDCT